MSIFKLKYRVSYIIINQYIQIFYFSIKFIYLCFHFLDVTTILKLHIIFFTMLQTIQVGLKLETTSIGALNEVLFKPRSLWNPTTLLKYTIYSDSTELKNICIKKMSRYLFFFVPILKRNDFYRTQVFEMKNQIILQIL